MNSQKKDTKGDIPEFLKRDSGIKDKEVLKKAYCKYIRDHNLTPEAASTAKIRMK